MILWNYDIAFSFKDVFVCRYNDTFASIKSKTDRQLSVNVGFHKSLFREKLILKETSNCVKLLKLSKKIDVIET